MTEIVQNNNSMKFDLIETGNGSPGAAEGDSSFNAMLGSIDIRGDKNTQYEREATDKDTQTESYILEILQILNESNLSLNDNELEDIKLRLKKLFEEIKFNTDDQTNLSPEQATSFTNKKFLYLMKFLEEMKGFINKKLNDVGINRDLESVLDKVRTKLNEHLKNILVKKINVNVKPQNHADINTNTGQNSNLKGITTTLDKNNKEFDSLKGRRANLGSLKNTDIKIELNASNLSNHKSFNNAQKQEAKLAQFSDMADKPYGKDFDTINQSSNIGTFSKELSSETTLLRQPITPTNKLDISLNSEPSNLQKPSMFSQENNDRLLQTLNMMSRTWGNKLIDKIEKSIVDGIEQLEIALTPKSLGRLNVTINIHDTITKINIVAESASAAALLSEAEQKLSTMMEASGLKLASLQTLTQQFGSKQKGKGQDHKLASMEKKSSIEEVSNSSENTEGFNNKSEGLNLIA